MISLGDLIIVSKWQPRNNMFAPLSLILFSKLQVQVGKVANQIILKRDPDLFVENRPRKLSLRVIMYCLCVSTLPKSVFPVLCGLCNLCRPATWTKFQRKSWLTAADRSCHGNIVMMVRICAAQLSIPILKQTPLFLLLPTKRVREVCCFIFFAVCISRCVYCQHYTVKMHFVGIKHTASCLFVFMLTYNFFFSVCSDREWNRGF